MVIKVSEFIGQNVAIWDDMEFLFAILFLHFCDVGNEPVLPCQLVAMWEMVNLLELLQLFINVGVDTTS